MHCVYEYKAREYSLGANHMQEKHPQDEYMVLFSGAKISRRNANKCGVALVSGLVGILVCLGLGVTHSAGVVVVLLLFVVLGYFWIGRMLFNK
jgi:hypothetical protein